MELLSVLFLIAGAISMIYYFIIISYAGMRASFSLFWFLISVISFIIFFVIRLMIRHKTVLPMSIKIVVGILFIMGAGLFSFIEGNIILHSNQKIQEEMNYLIILGAQVRGTRITKTLKARLDTAIQYLKENENTMVIVSGGQGVGEDISEAEAMSQYLLVHGIDPNRIIKEDKSTNTNENIRYSKAIILKDDAKTAIVTNGFHVYRALHIAKKQGFTNIQGLSAPSDPILRINYYVREVFGVIKDTYVGNM